MVSMRHWNTAGAEATPNGWQVKLISPLCVFMVNPPRIQGRYIVRHHRGFKILVISTLCENSAAEFSNLKGLKLDGNVHPVRAYTALTTSTLRGVIHGLGSTETQESLMASLWWTMSASNGLPRSSGVSVPSISTCMQPGHRPDVCPNLEVKVCRLSGASDPPATQKCQPKCGLCGDQHETGARGCPRRLKTVRKPPASSNTVNPGQGRKSRKDGMPGVHKARWFSSDDESMTSQGSRRASESGSRSRSKTRTPVPPLTSPTPAPRKNKPSPTTKQRSSIFLKFGFEESMGNIHRKKGELPYELTGLTENEVKLVQQTWRKFSSENPECGVLLFLSLFIKHPEYIQLFDPFRGKPIAALKDNPTFRAHGCSIGYHITSMVESLRDPGTFEILVRRNATEHMRRKGVKPLHFEVMGQRIVDVLQATDERHMTPAAVNAWRKFFA
ncbi:hypothetical protein V5799_023874, partial [Amblyomma americanum]